MTLAACGKVRGVGLAGWVLASLGMGTPAQADGLTRFRVRQATMSFFADEEGTRVLPISPVQLTMIARWLSPSSGVVETALVLRETNDAPYPSGECPPYRETTFLISEAKFHQGGAGNANYLAHETAAILGGDTKDLRTITLYDTSHNTRGPGHLPWFAKLSHGDGTVTYLGGRPGPSTN